MFDLIRESGDLLRESAGEQGLRRTGKVFKSLLDQLAREVSQLVDSLEADNPASDPGEEVADVASAPQTKSRRKANGATRKRRDKPAQGPINPRFKLSAAERKAVMDFMENHQGRLSLHDIAEEHKREYSELITERLPREYPGHSEEEYTAQALCDWLNFFLVCRGVARRLALDDPSELATCAILEGRLEWMGSYDVREGDCYPRVWPLLRALSAGDFVVAGKLAEAVRYPVREGHRDVVPLYNGLFAVLKHDWKYLRSLVPTFQKRKPVLWIGAMYPCLIGIAQESPSLVAEGLNKMYQTGRRRSVDTLEKTIYLEMHGMYELCRWVSPELVSQFDVDQPFPWDKEYCEFIRRCDDPSVNIRLEAVSPVLHNWVTTLCTPYWWVPADPDKVAEFQNQWNQLCEGLGRQIRKALGDSTTGE